MPRQHNYYVYILTNKRHTVLYTGVTNDLLVRSLQHREKHFSGFTKQYNIHKLVYYEHFDDIESAIAREKQIKKYGRRKKVIMINIFNPKWDDLLRQEI